MIIQAKACSCISSDCPLRAASTVPTAPDDGRYLFAHAQADLYDRAPLEAKFGQRQHEEINTMVLGLLVLAAIPTVTGVAQGISAKKQENAAMKEKIKFNMSAVLSVDGGPPTECWIVLRDGQVGWLEHSCFVAGR